MSWIKTITNRSRRGISLIELLLAIGSGVWADSIWIVALAVPAWAVLHFQIVVREEAYLAGLFPEAYGAYRARVLRWL